MAGNKACLTRLQKEYKQLLKARSREIRNNWEGRNKPSLK